MMTGDNVRFNDSLNILVMDEKWDATVRCMYNKNRAF